MQQSFIHRRGPERLEESLLPLRKTVHDWPYQFKGNFSVIHTRKSNGLDPSAAAVSRHKTPIGSISRRQPVIFVAALVFRQVAASRFLSGLLQKIGYIDAIMN